MKTLTRESGFMPNESLALENYPVAEDAFNRAYSEKEDEFRKLLAFKLSKFGSIRELEKLRITNAEELTNKHVLACQCEYMKAYYHGNGDLMLVYTNCEQLEVGTAQELAANYWADSISNVKHIACEIVMNLNVRDLYV